MTTAIEPSVETQPIVPARAAFAGFDCGDYPGDDVMTAWSGGKSPYSFICYYLDSICHGSRAFTAPWSGHRALLDQLGWGFVVTYVGRQVTGCGSTELSKENGAADGYDAVAKARAEEFPPGTIIFLDVEAISGSIPAVYLDYFGGWIAAVLSSEYRCGMYCTVGNHLSLISASMPVYAAKDPVGSECAEVWIVSLSSKFSLSSSPADCGVSYAKVWQGRFSVKDESHNAAAIPVIDLNVATSADPSQARIIQD